jgi:hypothetical protein
MRYHEMEQTADLRAFGGDAMNTLRPARLFLVGRDSSGRPKVRLVYLIQYFHGPGWVVVSDRGLPLIYDTAGERDAEMRRMSAVAA